MTHAYFSGDLLEPVKEAAKANMDLQRRRAVLVTAAFLVPPPPLTKAA